MPNNNNPLQAIQAFLSQGGANPNTPMGQNAANILKSGNQAQGEELANNFIRSLGMTKEQAVQSAMNFLRSRQR